MIYINARFLTQDLTGIQRFALEVCKELIKLREDISFLVPSLDEIKQQEYKNIFNIIEVKGGVGHYWEQVTLIKYLKKQGNPLLVNLGNTAPIFYKNKIFTHHDITYIRYPQSYSFKFRKIYELMARLNFRNSQSFITVSEFSKQDIATYYKVDINNIHVIYNGVSQNFENNDALKENNMKPFALAVSSPNYHKNFSAMIEAFLQANVDLELRIIGSAAGGFKSLDLTNIEDSNIKFLGRLSDEALIELYQTADFFIFPSLYEGFGIPPLEAQACGCPVISSNAASLPEVLKESAEYFNPQDVDEMAQKIRLIANDHNKRLGLKDAGFKNVARFSWGKSANTLNHIIELSIYQDIKK